jgi:hypothetical protein
MVRRKPQNVQIPSLDKSVPETAKLPYGREVKAFDIGARSDAHREELSREMVT